MREYDLLLPQVLYRKTDLRRDLNVILTAGAERFESELELEVPPQDGRSHQLQDFFLEILRHEVAKNIVRGIFRDVARDLGCDRGDQLRFEVFVHSDSESCRDHQRDAEIPEDMACQELNRRHL